MRILQTGAAPADRVGNRRDRLLLPDHSLVNPLLQYEQLSPLRLHHPTHRNPCPRANDLSDFLLRYIFTEQTSTGRLVLGNFAARFFFGETGTIHALRGKWRDIGAGGHTVPALATLHPQELLAAPASKALAWMDLLAFPERLQTPSNG